MSDGGRGRASLGVEVSKSSQEVGLSSAAIRFIARLGDVVFIRFAAIQRVDKC